MSGHRCGGAHALLRAGHVALYSEDEGCATRCESSELCYARSKLVGGHVQDCDADSRANKAFRDVQAEATGATGDDDDAALVHAGWKGAHACVRSLVPA